MDRRQRIELITGMLSELDCNVLKIFEEEIGMHLTDIRFYEIYSTIDEKYKHAAAINTHVKKFADMLWRQDD